MLNGNVILRKEATLHIFKSYYILLFESVNIYNTVEFIAFTAI